MGLVLFLPILGILLVLGSSQATASSLSTTTLVTKGIDNAGADNWAVQQHAGGQSYDGRYTVFSSESTNLIPNDTNEFSDIFLYDRITGKTELISHGIDGSPAKGNSYAPTISADGRYVSFRSASEYGPEDHNNWYDIYVRDIQGSTLTLVSKNAQGKAPKGNTYTSVISADGRSIVYWSDATDIVPNDTNRGSDIFLYDIQKKTNKRINMTTQGKEAYGSSYDPVISSDGSYIVYSSYADITGKNRNGLEDIFIYYRNLGITKQINRASHNGAFPTDSSCHTPSISGDGKAITYLSSSEELTPHKVDPWKNNLYLDYNPVVAVPYYDPNDILDILNP